MATIKCEACGRRLYESVIRECPLKKGHYICRYCCRKCKRHYLAEIGQGCKAFDEERAARIEEEQKAKEEKKKGK